jgi:hypothetical protein
MGRLFLHVHQERLVVESSAFHAVHHGSSSGRRKLAHLRVAKVCYTPSAQAFTDTHRWLLDNDHDEEGIVVIANLYGKGDIHNPKARDEYREIKMNVLLQRQEGERSYADMFKRYSKRVFIAMSAQALAQLNGINVISYYAPLVFEEAGWYGRQAILMTGINAITYLLSTIPPWYIVDSLGRRKILLSGALMMLISLSAISYFQFLQASWTPNMVVIFVMIYNAAFGYSWGPIPWLYPPEILPLSIRAKGASLSTATNWAFNWLVGEMTPILQEHIQWRLYLIHAFFCAASFVIGKSQLTFELSSLLTIPSIFHLPRNCQRSFGRHELVVRRRHLSHAHSGDPGASRIAV